MHVCVQTRELALLAPCDISLGVKDVTLPIPCQRYLRTANVRLSLSLSLWLWHNLPRCSLVFKPSRLRYPSLAFALILTAFFVLCRCVKKNKLLLNMQVNGNGCEDSPSRYPVMPARTPGVAPAATTASYTLPGTPTLLEEHSTIKSESRVHFLFCWFSKYECHTTCKTVCYSVWSVKKLISRPMQQVVCGKWFLLHMYSCACSCVCVLRSTVTVTSPVPFTVRGSHPKCGSTVF